MPAMHKGLAVLLLLCGTLLVACGKKGDQVYRTWVGPDRAILSVVTLHLGPKVRDVTVRDRELARAEYGTIQLAPGKYTLHEQDEASIGFTIRPLLIDADTARAAGELILGHTYTLHAGKSDGKRALWIEDARSGEIFIDTR